MALRPRQTSELGQQRDRVLDAGGDEGEELARFLTVTGPVVEDEGQVHDLAHGQLSVDDPGDVP